MRQPQRHLLTLFLGWILVLQLPAVAQENRIDRLFLAVPADTLVIRPDSSLDSLKLPDYFLIPHSDKLFQDKFKLLRGVHYRMEYREGIVRFLQPFPAGKQLTVIYRKYPLPLIPEYFHRELTRAPVDTAAGGGRGISTAKRSALWDEIDSFSSNLQKSGSIVRGIEIGSNRDLTLNSGLNLQLSGYITPDVQLVAALTDQSTPIQPEGNTQTLQELDKVFVKIKSPHLGGTLGDFNLIYGNSQFGNLNRKLQGVTAYGQAGAYHQQLTYATSRGTFFTNQFLGQEGNQGPYQLRGKNGQREIIVLAGTEKVYVNGVQQKRGENNQYIIDYGLAQITFTSRRLITSEDRIEVDFEYADNFQRYGKSLVGFSATRQKTGSNWGYDLRLFREWDDTNNLLENSSPLTDQEKEALKMAGDDRLKASLDGAEFVGAGNGTYLKRDSLISGKTVHFYRYVGRGAGDYQVRFAGVGPGNGSYVRERLGVYRFVGPGLGDYLPIRLIPLAGEKKLANLALHYRLGGHFTLTGEGAFSWWDQNVFSALDDNDNLGQAYNIGWNFDHPEARLFGKGLGKVQWTLKYRKREARFTPLDRQYQPEYNYKWNLDGNELVGDENILESRLNYQPWRQARLNLNGGWIRRGSDIESRRARAQLSLTDSTLIKGDGYLEAVSSRNGTLESRWNRAGAMAGHQFGRFFPYLAYKSENRRNRVSPDSLHGFFFQEQEAGVKTLPVWGMAWNWASRRRDDYLYDPARHNRREKLAVSLTHQLKMQILNARQWQGRLSFVYREKNYQRFFLELTREEKAQFQPDPQFQDTTWIDRRSYLANMELRYRNGNRTIDGNLDYKVASELQAQQEKVFLKVGENRGNYRYDEILQEYVPDPQGDYILIILPTGQYQPVTRVAASWQLRYRPKISRKKARGIQKILRNISTFTFMRVDERSREANVWQLYILNLNKFHNPATTLQGSYLVNQDVYLFERNPAFGVTLRSRYRDNMANQFVDASFNETRRSWERLVIWRQKLWKNKLSQQVQYRYNTIYRSVSAQPSRNRNITDHSVEVKWIYRPVYRWQFRLGLEGGWQRDHAESNPLTVRYYQLQPEVHFSMKGKARGIANLTYLAVRDVANPLNRPIPFEMGKGKKSGNSFLWNLRFEYFLSGNISITANYTGRRDAGAAQTIHLGQAEVRAFF